MTGLTEAESNFSTIKKKLYISYGMVYHIHEINFNLQYRFYSTIISQRVPGGPVREIKEISGRSQNEDTSLINNKQIINTISLNPFF